MPKLIGQDLWFHNMEVDNYLSSPLNAVAYLTMAQKADMLADLGEQLRTDDAVEDSFLEALDYDIEHEGEFTYDDPRAELTFDEWAVLKGTRDEIKDLCDIVAAVEKGHILYG